MEEAAFIRLQYAWLSLHACMGVTVDEVERVEELIRKQLRLNVEQFRTREGSLYVGLCLNCGVRLPSPMRWCSHFCREGWKQLRHK